MAWSIAAPIGRFGWTTPSTTSGPVAGAGSSANAVVVSGATSAAIESIELIAMRPSADAPAEGTVPFMVRPERVALSATAPTTCPAGTTVLEGLVQHVADLGPLVRVTTVCRGTELLASMGHREYNGLGIVVGSRIFLAVAAEDVHVMTT